MCIRDREYIEYYPYADYWSGRINSENRETLVGKVRSAAALCDFLVVGIHDGLEYVKEPFPAQVSLYRCLLYTSRCV